MFVLTNGKDYIMENPMRVGEYIKTTSLVQATRFNYKQARGFVQKYKKRYNWLKGFYLVDAETGEKSEKPLAYKGNEGLYLDSDFDDSILDKIINESHSIIGLAGWDIQQLHTYKNLLNTQLSICDSGESDVKHALEKYKEVHNGRKPQAHKVAKLGYLLDELRDRHKRIKLCIRYIQIMEDAITYKYTINKIKYELSKAQNCEYKGRTQYWAIAKEILED